LASPGTRANHSCRYWCGQWKTSPLCSFLRPAEQPIPRTAAGKGGEPIDIDYVLLTHLHVDHVGWNTRLEGHRWVPTFPKAQYLFSRAEREYFTDPKNHTEGNRTSFQVQNDSIDPIIEAGLVDPIEVDGTEPIEGFIFYPTPGHSVRHASIGFRSGDGLARSEADGRVSTRPCQPGCVRQCPLRSRGPKRLVAEQPRIGRTVPGRRVWPTYVMPGSCGATTKMTAHIASPEMLPKSTALASAER
jgi:hypothetical protein